MKNRLRFLLTALTLLLLGKGGFEACAQNPQTLEVGPHFGLTSYVGDLNVWRNMDQWQWKSLHQFDYEVGGVVRFNYDSRWAFRLDYTYGKVMACDTAAAWRPEAMLNFRTSLHDLSLMVEFNFLNYYTGRPESSISPYVFAGISGFSYTPRPYAADTALAPLINGISLREMQTESRAYNQFSMSIPFGVGCKFSLSKHLAATVEWRMHYTFTDYLDDVSGVYPAEEGHAQLTDTDGSLIYDFTDPTGSFGEGYQRGNSQTNDWFGMINLSLTWKFVIPNSSACKMNIE